VQFKRLQHLLSLYDVRNKFRNLSTKTFKCFIPKETKICFVLLFVVFAIRTGEPSSIYVLGQNADAPPLPPSL